MFTFAYTNIIYMNLYDIKKIAITNAVDVSDVIELMKVERLDKIIERLDIIIDENTYELGIEGKNQSSTTFFPKRDSQKK